MLAFKLIANVNKGGGWYSCLLCVRVGEVEVFVCVFTFMIETKKFNKPHTNEHTHKRTHLSPQTHKGALIHWRDYQWSMTGLTLGCTGLCLCLSVPSYWDASLCAHTVCVTVKLFVFGFSCLWRVWEKKGEEEDREKERGGEIKAERWQKRKKGTTRTKKCAIFPFVSIPPSLAHTQ